MAVACPDGQPSWFALQVKGRHERSIAGLLKGKAYEPFLPLYQTTRRWSDRTKRVELPLFPGYLFCRFNPHNRLPILSTPGVLKIVGTGNCPLPVDDAEISAIQRIVESGLQAQPWPFLQLGDRVEVKSGALSGLEGVLTAFKGGRRLVVSVSLLQRSVAVELDGAMVNPLANKRRPRQPFAQLGAAPTKALAES